MRARVAAAGSALYLPAFLWLLPHIFSGPVTQSPIILSQVTRELPIHSPSITGCIPFSTVYNQDQTGKTNYQIFMAKFNAEKKLVT